MSDLSPATPPPSSPVTTGIVYRLDLTISPGGGAFRDEERPFQCPEPGCYQRFKRKFTLTEHVKTHTGERPFMCPVRSCGKSFATSGNLARHKRLHPWLKPQVCLVDGCGRSFSNEVKLERHLKTHFKGPQPFLLCDVEGCGKSFSTVGNLTRHLKHQHREYECKQATPREAASVMIEYRKHHLDVAPSCVARVNRACEAFNPLSPTQPSPVSDEELLEFLDGLF